MVCAVVSNACERREEGRRQGRERERWKEEEGETGRGKEKVDAREQEYVIKAKGVLR